MKLTVNGAAMELGEDYASGSLLWALRDGLGLTGAKFGCGVGICGSCTVQIDGRPVRSCQVAAASVAGKSILTVEGLAGDAQPLHPVQQAFIEHQVPQCAWCMNGQIMTALAFLKRNPAPTRAQIVQAMNANYCRCGCYGRIRLAVERAARLLREQADA